VTWTRQDLENEIKYAADADGSGRWSPSTVTRIADLVYRREWRNILNANPVYRFSERAVSTDANGQIALSALSTATERLYRILHASQGDFSLKWIDVNEQPMGGGANTYLALGRRGMYLLGNNLQILPAEANCPTTVAVNHIPIAISSLAAGDPIEFPADYEPILALEGGAMMLMKGGAESSQAGDLQQVAEMYRSDLLNDISRIHTQPRIIAFPDNAEDWGS